MNYREFKKAIAKQEKKKREEKLFALKKAEIEKTKNSLEDAVAKTYEKCDEYLVKAKDARKKGDEFTCRYYVDLIKLGTNSVSVSRKLLLQLIAVSDMWQQQTLNESASNVIASVTKGVLKTCEKLIGKTSGKDFGKAIHKNSIAIEKLEKVLGINENALSVGLGNVSDDEIYALIDEQQKSDEIDFKESVERLESEFLGKTPVKVDNEIPGQIVSENAEGSKEDLKGVKESEEESDIGVSVDKATIPARDTIIDRAESDQTEEKSHTESADNAKSRVINIEGASLRPQRLKDYIGQEKAVATLTTPIRKALLTGGTLPHIILSASYGQGKTTLAKIIANEVEGNFIEISSGVKYRDMLRTLKELKKGDVVFIDEIHNLDTSIIEQLLYPAMEDFELHYSEGNGLKTVNKTVEINPFTLIGATTETGLLLKPFYSKFKINVTLEEYKLETITAIIINSFRHNGYTISESLAEKVAKRSRLSPRQANAFVEGIGSRALVKAADLRGIKEAGALSDIDKVKALGINIEEADVDEYFKGMRIDERGVKEDERRILRLIAVDYNGGPIGIENIAKAMNMSTNRISDEYEPFLVKLGLIGIRTGGRFATDAAYEYLGIKRDGSPAENTELSGDNDKIRGEVGDNVYETGAVDEEDTDIDDGIKVYVCKESDFVSSVAERLIGLFSGRAMPTDETLDELFEDVDKNYESTAANVCLVKMGARTVYCDSKLERRFITYIYEKGVAEDVRSECLELEYSSSQESGKRYYPDFCLKLYDGTIAVLEMKELSAIGYHLNVDKYEALVAYCEKHGYRYAQIAKDHVSNRYISAEQLKVAEINESLRDYIILKIEENGACTAQDLKDLGYDEKELATILLNDRTLKNTDRHGNEHYIIRV